ncbi:hypothetical protein DFH29DRAFT_936450 [Suillus ampliporus]|nr:hypothetical protein DFH29DRAFT_936450 [Suillus ampliporus]
MSSRPNPRLPHMRLLPVAPCLCFGFLMVCIFEPSCRSLMYIRCTRFGRSPLTSSQVILKVVLYGIPLTLWGAYRLTEARSRADMLTVRR